MAGIQSGELQTLVSTLQNGNVQLGNLYQAIQALNTGVLSGAMSTTATSATAGTASALPSAPAGYITVNIPGVGNRKMPYYGI